MSKGLRKLRKFFDEGNRSLERNMRHELVEKCIAVMDKENMSPYAISKICRYLGQSSMDSKT